MAILEERGGATLKIIVDNITVRKMASIQNARVLFALVMISAVEDPELLYWAWKAVRGACRVLRFLL